MQAGPCFDLAKMRLGRKLFDLIQDDFSSFVPA